jgi:hypothetical protein
MKVHYRVHKSSPLLSILNHMNSDHTTTFYFSTIILKLYSHLRLGLPSGFLLLDFLPNCCIDSPFFHTYYMTCQSHHSDYIWRRVRVMKLFIMQFSPLSNYFIPFRSKHSPQGHMHAKLMSHNIYRYLGHEDEKYV